MANEESYRPRKLSQIVPPLPDDYDGDDVANGEANPFDSIQAVREAAAAESGQEVPNSGLGNVKMSGSVPPELLQRIKNNNQPQEPKRGFSGMGKGSAPTPPSAPKFDQRGPVVSASSAHLKELIEGLKPSTTVYEAIELPSGGRFYDGTNGPADGVLSIRPMTGEEEQILATPRFVRKGQAINMIFQRCMKENFKPENLLTIDRTYLLIYLRGISYTPHYDVEVKCPDCEKKFATTIDLNTLYVEPCPENYGPVLEDVLPASKYRFAYRLSTGRDEQDIQEHRERRARMFGDGATDDTLTYRTAQLLEHIEGLSSKSELQTLIKNLPIADVAHIRNCINEPPFGVDTNIEIICPSCMHDFEVDLPLEANFFFPRRKKEKTQA